MKEAIRQGTASIQEESSDEWRVEKRVPTLGQYIVIFWPVDTSSISLDGRSIVQMEDTATSKKLVNWITHNFQDSWSTRTIPLTQ